jgi:hypothetical protein
MDVMRHELDHRYVLHGSGGITTVQSRVVRHGFCSDMFWNPSPPDWRFQLQTYLTADELRELLEDVSNRFHIQCSMDSSVFKAEVMSS